MKQMAVFEKKKDNFSVYVARASSHCTKAPYKTITKKRLVYITKMYKIYVSQKCLMNTINLKVSTKIIKMIQSCYAYQI